MEESGSEGLEDLIRAEADKYFKNVDAVCISDNYWLGTRKPVITYGLRGVSYFHLTIKGPGKKKKDKSSKKNFFWYIIMKSGDINIYHILFSFLMCSC